VKFYRETEFQETEIGKIPQDWKVTKLGEITLEMYYGLTAKAVDYPTELKMLRTTDIKDYNVFWENLPYCEITDNRKFNIEKYLLRRDDIIISRAGTAGVSVLVEKDFENVIFGSYLIKVRLNTSLAFPKFIHYYFQSRYYWKQILPQQAGSTLKNISLPTLRRIVTPLPPFEEQKRITGILSTVDKTLEDVDKTISRLERLKKALMGELLSGRIRVKEIDGKLTFYRETEFQETEIGKIPKDWKIKKLGELLKFAHGKRPGMLLTNSGIPIYGAGGFYGYTNTYLVNKPAILVIARVGKGSVGKVYLVRGSVWITDNAIYGYSKDPSGLTATYTYHWLIFDKNWVEKYVRRSAGGYAIITLDSLENFKIPVPTIDEQTNIVNVIYLFTKVIELHHEEKIRLEHLKRGLMHMLLTGKIRVRES
jgi:type I restriction enzyme S subunit